MSFREASAGGTSGRRLSASDPEIGKRLCGIAFEQMELAYAPYSKFRVGCALLADGGEVVTGVNVENASYGLTICAERCAVCAAVARGYRRFLAVAVAADEPGATPCGACRQVLSEFMAPEAPVYFIGSTREIVETTIGDLLPRRFAGPRASQHPE